MPEPLLAVRPGAMGDTLLMAPVLRGIKQQCHVSFVGTMPQARFLEDWGVVDSVIDYEMMNLYSPPVQAVSGSRVILFLPPDKAAGEAFRAAGARNVHFAEPVPGQPGGHIVEHAAAVFRDCGIVCGPDREPFPIPFERTNRCDVAGSAIVFPGSGSVKKNWPLEKAAAVAEDLRQRRLVVRWLVGPAEEDRGLRRELPAGAEVLSGLDVAGLAVVLARARLVVGNDSGPVHLAALMGVPTIALFQVSDPATWMPWGKRVICLGGPGKPPGVGEVLSAIDHLPG